MTEENKNLDEYMDASEQLRQAFEDFEKFQEKQENEFWENLTYDQKQLAFGAVVRRIVKGDIVDKGSYRYVLYNVFGFEPDAYLMGMNCGYMALHNAIITDDDDEQPTDSGSGV